MLRRSVSLARSPRSLLITSRGIQQHSGPSHATTQSNNPPIPPAVYTYSGRASSSEIHTETTLGKRASYHIHLLPVSQLTHTDASVTITYLHAQHRHTSVDRHEPVRVVVLHYLPSAAKIPFSHAPSLLSPSLCYTLSSRPVRHL
jgi:hypothetical protein